MSVACWGRVVRIVAVGVVFMGASRLAEAQSAVYGIGGPAGVSGFFRTSSNAVHAAGGVDVLAAGRVGVSGEFGIFGNISSVLWVTSANGTFALVDGSAARVVPFVTGGYTRMSSGDGSFNAWNVGAGINAWLGERIGVRADFRDHVRPDSRGNVQYWTVRAGVVVRVG
jgi:hypothetical protein